MPSVMTTSSGICASIASMMASLENFGGTKATETSAPVLAIASSTVANTGSSTVEPSALVWVTVVPALRALTPPTMLVPALSIRAVCLVPSPPVMPWTMTLESLLRRIVIFCGSSLLSGCERGGLVGSLVHGSDNGDQRVVRLRQDAPPLLDVVAVETDHQRLVGRVAQLAQGADDAVGHRVTGGDAAADVDEDTLDLRVAQADVQTVGHDLRRGAATDVQEVGGRDPAVVLARVGDDVQGRHDQAGTVTDDTDLAVELDVVQIQLAGLDLERVGGVQVREL